MTTDLAQPLPTDNHPTFKQRPFNRRSRIVNGIMFTFCTLCAVLVLGLLASILGYVLYRGASSINLALFTNLPNQHPTGLRNAIAGTLILIVAASVVGVPLGILCGIYLAEFAKDNRFTRTVRLVVDVLAGTPSIIVGVLAYQLVVIPMGGPSGWAGVVALSFMMVPIISRTTEEMLRLVPGAYREASIGVGASRFQTLFLIVLPAARAGIVTGVMLAVARIAGETAPLYFTTFGSNLPVVEMQSGWAIGWQLLLVLACVAVVGLAMSLNRWTQRAAMPFTIAAGISTAAVALVAGLTHWTGIQMPRVYFDKPYPTMTVAIFENATSAEPSWVNAAWAGMVVLILIILVLNLLVRYVSRNRMLGT